MFQNPNFKKRKRKSKKSKNDRCDSFMGFVVSRKPQSDLLSPPHLKFSKKLKCRRDRTDFHNLQNKFNIRQEQVYDRSRVEELNRSSMEKRNTSTPGGIVRGKWIHQNRFSEDIPTPQFQANISKDLSSLSANQRRKTPPRNFKKFKCSPKPSIFSKFKKVIPSIGEELPQRTPAFTPRILNQFESWPTSTSSDEENGQQTDDLTSM